jgi:hypothetical protein
MKIFDKVKIDGIDYVLTLTELIPKSKVMLVSCVDFNRYMDAVVVSDYHDLSKEEILKVTDGRTYTVIENILEKI